MAATELPIPVSEAGYRAFLTLWAFFMRDESVGEAPMYTLDVERAHDVRRHLAEDWTRLHPRVRRWIPESEAWWHQVSAAWGPTAKDERRRSQLRGYFRPQFATLSRLWSAADDS